MRILLMADSFGATGGGEVMVGYLARQLRKRHNVAVLTAGSGPTERTCWNGVDVYHVRSEYHARLRPVLSIVNPATTRGVNRLLGSFKPEIVHAWNVHHHLGYEAIRLASKYAPVVHTSQDALAFCYTKFHCWIDPGHIGGPLPAPRAHPDRCRNCRSLFWSFPARNRLIRAYLERCVRAPIAVSRALADGLVANGLPEPRVVHNGIPADDFASDPSIVRGIEKRWGLGTGPAVLAGGRLSHFKGHERALRAFSRASQVAPGAQLLIMGGYGGYSERLAGIAAELGVADKVKFLGLVPRSDVPAVLRRSTAVLTLSMYLDPFPTMNLEAMAASRAVLGTCFGGTPEAVEDGLTGYIVNPYDDAGVSARIAQVLANPSDAARLGNAGQERLLEHFTIERMTAAYELIYQGLAGS